MVFLHRNKKIVDYSQFGDLEDDGKWCVLVCNRNAKH